MSRHAVIAIALELFAASAHDLRLSGGQRTPRASKGLAVEGTGDRTWVNVIEDRRSRREFERVRIDPEVARELRAALDEFTPFEDVRVELIEDDALDVFTARAGGHGKVSNPVAALVVLGALGSLSTRLHAGYVGEAAVLQATRLGLDSCWMHRYFSPTRLSRYLKLKPSEGIVAVIPVGYGTLKSKVGEKITAWKRNSKSRLPLEQMASKACLEYEGCMFNALIEAARLAPSPLNRQVCRFDVNDGRLLLSVAETQLAPEVGRTVDAGIAMLHVDFAAKSNGLVGRWTESTGRNVASWGLVAS